MTVGRLQMFHLSICNISAFFWCTPRGNSKQMGSTGLNTLAISSNALPNRHVLQYFRRNN